MGFWEFVLRAIVVPIVVLAVVLGLVPIWIWMERRVAARIQQRIGPNRVGPEGLLQPMADAVKLLFKEDITPARVDRGVYMMAPVLAILPSMAALAVIPLGPGLQVADVNIGILYILALSSLAVYGVVLAGWSSNNKWSLMGGIRSAAQMVSYELGMGLSIIAVVLSSSLYANAVGHADTGYPSALSLRTIIESQSGVSVLVWNVFWHFPAFVIFWIRALAESNRAPFDLPEAEQELVGGFHTEYSAFRFAMFFMGEYVHMTTLSAVAAALFLGGWMSPFANIPLLGQLTVSGIPVLNWVAPILWYIVKIVFFIFLYMWVRWTLPRMRWDQLMKLGWMVLLPGAVAWVIVSSVLHGVATAVAGPGRMIEGLDALDVYRIFVAIGLVAVGLVVWVRKLELSPADGRV